MAADLPAAWRAVPQHLIISHLGITPQYLSRIERAHLERAKEWRARYGDARGARAPA